MYRLIALAGLVLAASAFAAPGLWYAPDRPGHGISISQPTEGGYAVLWYLPTRSGVAAYLIADPCPDFPCVSALYSPAARWLGGGLNMGEPVGEIEIGVGEPLPVRYDLRAWDVETCTGISPGGVLFRECAGRLELERLAP